MHAGLVRALEQWGVEVMAVPAIPELAPHPSANWLARIQRLCGNTSFDQVWLWLLHYPYSPEFLAWVKTLAPVRIGLLGESMRYDEEAIQRHPALAERPNIIMSQCEALTHVLACDEVDATELSQRLGIQAMWVPGVVPEAQIVVPDGPPHRRHAVFHGTSYVHRNSLLNHPALEGKLQSAHAPPSAFPALFDELQHCVAKGLLHEELGTLADLAQYVRSLHRIRHGEFVHWMQELRTWPAIVNLPSLARFYGGRVFEALAAGRPVISWSIPERPRNRALFQEGKEILLFERDDAEGLAGCIDRLLTDTVAAQEMVCRAQTTLRQWHTVEHRIDQILTWIRTGKEPTYGIADHKWVDPADDTYDGRPPDTHVESRSGFVPGLPRAASRRGGASEVHMMTDDTPQPFLTTVFLITVDDPAFPTCLESIRRQHTQRFILDIVRQYRPMSVALQEMLRRCRTAYAIQVDEDMILDPDAISTMEATMRTAPSDVGLICFHLYDEDLGRPIQGIKIYRAELIRTLQFRDVKACEMDFLEQMAARGIRWALHEKIVGKHGTLYTPESIYRRYKTLYEKDIVEWNCVTTDLRTKALRYRESGDPLHLFALLGAMDGIVSAPFVQDREKDAATYQLKQLDVVRRILESSTVSIPYERGAAAKRKPIPPLRLTHDGNGTIQHKDDSRPSADSMHLALRAPASDGQACRSQGSYEAGRVLLVTPFFYPSFGGVEIIAETLGVQLVRRGYRVDVATTALPHRKSHTHREMLVHDLPVANRQEQHASLRCLHTLIQSGAYRACLVLSDPRHLFFQFWASNLRMPETTQLIVQPLINEEGYATWKDDHRFRSMLRTVFQKAQAVVSLTRTGLIPDIVREANGYPHYVPNATSSFTKVDGQAFRQQHDLQTHDFVILHVANINPMKNHRGLLRELRRVPSHWRLVLIGYPPADPALHQYYTEVTKICAELPHVRYLSGLEHERIGEAMAAADMVVLPSTTEISPVTILEAMSMKRPWLATPMTGECLDRAGGIVAPLEEFKVMLEAMDAHPEFRERLGQAGYDHWASCYEWSVVIDDWIALIEQGQVRHSFAMPDPVSEAMRQLGEEFARLLGNPTYSVESVDARSVIDGPMRNSGTTDGRESPSSTCSKESPNGHNRYTAEGAPAGQNRPFQREQEERFYTNLFVLDPHWSGSAPNADEQARWSVIRSFLECWKSEVGEPDPHRIRILDVGCGRGWLTNLLQSYGECEGVEPIEPVVKHARHLFPHLRFYSCLPEQLIEQAEFRPYDMVVTSEVIEHVPHDRKRDFVRTLRRLVKLGGWVIVSTPRGEVFEQWRQIAPPNQPIEDWITEHDLARLFMQKGFEVVRHERIYFDSARWIYVTPSTLVDSTSVSIIPLYQVWAFRATYSIPLEPHGDEDHFQSVSISEDNSYKERS